MLETALIGDNQMDRDRTMIDRIPRNGDSSEARLLPGPTKFAAQAAELNPNNSLRARVPKHLLAGVRIEPSKHALHSSLSGAIALVLSRFFYANMLY